ncbi:MAG: pentapeptide repeat-containing protein [Chitinivibrionales bacterium]
MVVVFLFICLAIYPLKLAAEDTDKDSIFMCTEKPVDSLQRRMVYGYVDGEKTECMTKQELLSLFSQREFEKKQDSILTEKEKKNDYYVDAIARGQKDLKKATLPMADLMGAKLINIDFSYANLSSADLRNADLSGAILRGADLSVAYCKDADFSGADLSGANLEGTYLNGANLTDVSGLSYELLKKARTIHAARLDSTLIKQIKEDAPHLLEKPKQGWIQNTWAPADSQKSKK